MIEKLMFSTRQSFFEHARRLKQFSKCNLVFRNMSQNVQQSSCPKLVLFEIRTQSYFRYIIPHNQPPPLGYIENEYMDSKYFNRNRKKHV